MIGEPYCFQGNVLTPKNIPRCVYPGTINSYCKTEKKDEMQLCVRGIESCSSGKCVIVSTQPCSDSDGGRDYDRQGVVRDGFQKVYVDNCQDERWLIERYCSNGNKGEGITEIVRCDYECRSGACVDEDEAEEADSDETEE